MGGTPQGMWPGKHKTEMKVAAVAAASVLAALLHSVCHEEFLFWDSHLQCRLTLEPVEHDLKLLKTML